MERNRTLEHSERDRQKHMNTVFQNFKNLARRQKVVAEIAENEAEFTLRTPSSSCLAF